MLRDLWAYRLYILGGAVREVRQRYAGSAMGVLWHVITPLVQIVVYFVVFSRFMGGVQGGGYSGRSYVLYLCAGILPWFVFAETLNFGASSLLSNENYLKKLAIPESVFVAQTVAPSGLTLLLYTSALCLMALCAGIAVSWTWVLVPIVLILLLGMGFGLAVVLGTLAVFFRDLVQILGIALQIWFWVTPIIYEEAAVGPGLRAVIQWNPPAAYIAAVRDLLIGGVVPDWSRWIWMGSLALLSPALGLLVLNRLRADLRDAL